MRSSVMRISILGATGSIGDSALDIIQRNPDRFEVVALVAGSNVEKLAEAARSVRAQCAVVADESKYEALCAALAGTGIACSAGENAVLEAVDQPTDMVIGAIVGAAGLKPTLRALRSTKAMALANKECLVCAGDLFMKEVRALNVTLLPMDSEHSAIFQIFEQANADKIEKVILTASGGPFRNSTLDELKVATRAQALNHPNWSMGSRITIDSATMMNKGFEVIEAFHLFPVEADQLDVLVHPQSVVHGLVQYADGSLLAQLGSPDMRTPIAHCMAWPERMDVPVERLDLAQIAQLSFEKPDVQRFPALRLAREAMEAGGVAPTVLNAADEIGVAAFLNERIGFMDIPALVEDVLERVGARSQFALSSVDDVLAVDREARELAENWIFTRS